MLRVSKIVALSLGLVFSSQCCNAGDREIKCIGSECYTQQFNSNMTNETRLDYKKGNNKTTKNESCLNCSDCGQCNNKVNKKEVKRIEKKGCINCQKYPKKFQKNQNKQSSKGSFNTRKK